MPKRAAIYRLLYGEDFIKQSIESIIGAVEEVYVFWTNTVWGAPKAVRYKGKNITFPDQFDDAVNIVKSIDSKKINLVEDYYPSPHNQFTYLANNFVLSDIVLLIEHDQVIKDPEQAFREFEESGAKTAAMPQIEYWKTKEYRVPQRHRPGPIFWRMPLGETRPNGMPVNGNVVKLSQEAENYGFCVSDKTMYWKHLTALAFSPIIGDSIPYEGWYEEVWKEWTPGMRNLEISKNARSAIPYAIKTG